jgi:hypothetical protein
MHEKLVPPPRYLQHQIVLHQSDTETLTHLANQYKKSIYFKKITLIIFLSITMNI